MVILMSEEKPINAMYGQKVKLDLDKLRSKSKSENDENKIEEPVVEEVSEPVVEVTIEEEVDEVVEEPDEVFEPVVEVAIEEEVDEVEEPIQNEPEIEVVGEPEWLVLGDGVVTGSAGENSVFTVTYTFFPKA